MAKETTEDLGVFTDPSGGEASTPLPTLSSSSTDVTTALLEDYEVACYLRDFMDKSTLIDGMNKFLEWPYVHHPFTRSNSTGCSSLFSNN
jgi:hypothetical protein